MSCQIVTGLVHDTLVVNQPTTAMKHYNYWVGNLSIIGSVDVHGKIETIG